MNDNNKCENAFVSRHGVHDYFRAVRYTYLLFLFEIQTEISTFVEIAYMKEYITKKWTYETYNKAGKIL